MRNIPWLLIDKYLKGLLTNRDQEDLEGWLRSEPENPLFLKFLAIWLVYIFVLASVFLNFGEILDFNYKPGWNSIC